jgi:aspartate ammonia-lyase
MKSSSERVEGDFLGEIEIAQGALFGAQTQRAVLNFPVGTQRTIGGYPRLIEGLMFVKQAAALANRESGFLDKTKAQAIIDAASQILHDKQFEHFPIHRLHGGGGTSANMNANEVLANLGEELLGGKRGEYRLLHPNDHVNLHQSTNDVYPTACHIAIIRQWPDLRSALGRLVNSFQGRAFELAKEEKIARTCLQDAVVITFKDLLKGYASFLNRGLWQIGKAVDDLYNVNLGGTIVGRRGDVPESYFRAIIHQLQKATGDANYRMAEDLFDSAQNPDDMVQVSSQLNLLARGLIKVCKDFRLMSSGPEAGFSEIQLPATQPGSSTMPGKINPVIPEFAVQLCFQVIGNHAACQAALDHGELDLNIWESTIVFNVLDSMELLSNAISTFDEKCVRGFIVNSSQNSKYARSTISVLTDLMKGHGYSRIDAICKQAGADMELIKKMIKEQDL